MQVHRGLPSPLQSPREQVKKKGCAPGLQVQRTDGTGANWAGLSPERLPCGTHSHTVPASPGTESTTRAMNRAPAESPFTGTKMGARVRPATRALCNCGHAWDHPDGALGRGVLPSMARSPSPPHPPLHTPPLPALRTTLSLWPDSNHLGHQSPDPQGLPAAKDHSATPPPSASLVPTLSALVLGPGDCC